MPIDIREAVEDSLYNDAYTMSWSVNNDRLTLSPKEKLMPQIECIVEEEDGRYYLRPQMTFPQLKYEDMYYFDDFQYYLKEWAEIGSYMNSLVKFSFEPDDEEYDETEYDEFSN